MELNHEQIWQQLRQAAREAAADEAAELARIEAMLAKAPPGDTAPFTSERVRTMVAEATGVPPEQLAPASLLAPAATPRHSLASIFASLLAFLLAPQFLGACTLAAVAATGSYFITHSTQTLAYPDAIRIMLDEAAPQEARCVGQGTAYMDVQVSIEALQQVQGDAALGSQVRSLLAELRRLAATDAASLASSLRPLPPSKPCLELCAIVGEARVPTAQRAAALAQLDAQLICGIRAQAAAATRDGPGPLTKGATVALSHLRKLLGS